jgi:hypothetical protein
MYNYLSYFIIMIWKTQRKTADIANKKAWLSPCFFIGMDALTQQRSLPQ